jgi:hypothetical protein
MEYTPKYAKGQIHVIFKYDGDYTEDFVRKFSKALGYELIKEHGGNYIFKTEVGKEKEAVERFREYSKFVEYADLRDIKMDLRHNSLELAIDQIQELQQNVELSNSQYNQKLKDISVYINQLKI